MAATIAPTRITYGFSLLNQAGVPSEIAEFSLWTDLGGAVAPTDVDAALSDIGQKAYDAWGANQESAGWRPGVVLDHVKVSKLNNALLTQAEQVHSPTTKWAGTNGNPGLPWSCSWVLSLYSYTPGTFIVNARNRRGRIYMPPFASTTLDNNNEGTLTSSHVDTLLADSKAWLVAVNNIEPATSPAGVMMGLGVLSRVSAKVKRTTPELYGLTDIAADGIIDVQRRRTHQQPRTRRQLGLGLV